MSSDKVSMQNYILHDIGHPIEFHSAIIVLFFREIMNSCLLLVLHSET